MSQADLETLRAVYEAVSRGDWDAVFRNARPDFELRPPDQSPVAGTYGGPEQVRRFVAELWAAFAEVTAQPEQFLELDDRILVFVHLQLRPNDSEAKVEMRIAHLWTMRDGKIARCEVLTEREHAVKAAGLSLQAMDRAGDRPAPRSS
jgi:uncharacterized protein